MSDGCIYLPICSFHTKAHAAYLEMVGVFTCQYAAFTPLGRDGGAQNWVYLPANMQLSHLGLAGLHVGDGCIYLPICSFHTWSIRFLIRFCGVFTCQYAAFTPITDII